MAFATVTLAHRSPEARHDRADAVRSAAFVARGAGFLEAFATLDSSSVQLHLVGYATNELQLNFRFEGDDVDLVRTIPSLVRQHLAVPDHSPKVLQEALQKLVRAAADLGDLRDAVFADDEGESSLAAADRNPVRYSETTEMRAKLIGLSLRGRSDTLYATFRPTHWTKSGIRLLVSNTDREKLGTAIGKVVDVKVRLRVVDHSIAAGEVIEVHPLQAGMTWDDLRQWYRDSGARRVGG